MSHIPGAAYTAALSGLSAPPIEPVPFECCQTQTPSRSDLLSKTAHVTFDPDLRARIAFDPNLSRANFIVQELEQHLHRLLRGANEWFRPLKPKDSGALQDLKEAVNELETFTKDHIDSIPDNFATYHSLVYAVNVAIDMVLDDLDFDRRHGWAKREIKVARVAESTLSMFGFLVTESASSVSAEKTRVGSTRKNVTDAATYGSSSSTSVTDLPIDAVILTDAAAYERPSSLVRGIAAYECRTLSSRSLSPRRVQLRPEVPRPHLAVPCWRISSSNLR